MIGSHIDAELASAKFTDLSPHFRIRSLRKDELRSIFAPEKDDMASALRGHMVSSIFLREGDGDGLTHKTLLKILFNYWKGVDF